MSAPKLTVLVTGFEPFGNDEVYLDVNASMEAVKLIDKDIEDRLNIQLNSEFLPVEYREIDSRVPKMWEDYQPHLTIHVGVKNTIKGFQLELQARKGVYDSVDTVDFVPEGRQNPCEGPETITSDLNVEHICMRFNDVMRYENSVPEQFQIAVLSDTAGGYLCEYLLYSALCQHPERRTTLFVHVPAVSSPEEFSHLARGLERLIEICVQQLRDRAEPIEKAASCCICQ